MSAFAPMVLAWILGLSLIAALLDRPRTGQEWIGRVALAAPVGLGVTSLFAFAWLFVAGGIGPGYWVADALLCLTGACALLLVPRVRDVLRPPALDRVQIVTLAMLLIAAAFATWRFVAATQQLPHGEWDAWEVWNHRARHIFRAGEAWQTAFAAGIKSTEYPLLIPLSVVRAWAYGGESTVGPAAVAGLFTIGGSLIVAGLVSRLSGVVAGTASGLLLFGTSSYQSWGALQYGDVPLATFGAGAAGVLFAGVRREPEESAARPMVLGGLLLGLAGWTKTDGVAVAAVIALTIIAREIFRRRRGAVLYAAKWMALGAAAPGLAWVAQHVFLAPALVPVLTTGQEGVIGKLTDAGRWATVLAWFFEHAPGQDVWLAFLVLGIAALQGARPGALLRSPALWCAGAVYLVDALVFVVTPLDLEFHLVTAGDRLMLHAWPLFILGVFAAVEPRSAVGASRDVGPREESPDVARRRPRRRVRTG